MNKVIYIFLVTILMLGCSHDNDTEKELLSQIKIITQEMEVVKSKLDEAEKKISESEQRKTLEKNKGSW